MQVKDLKKILEIHGDDIDNYDVTIFDIATGNRIVLDWEDIDTTCRDLFEINVDSTKLRDDYEDQLTSKTLSCEIDSELFFNEISMDTKAWNFDYDSLEDYPEVEEYLKENYEQEYNMLKNGKADYIEVWYD